MKEVEEESSPSIGLYTCAPLYIVRRMPQIQAERDISLFIEGKMALSQFEPYINKVKNSPSLSMLIILLNSTLITSIINNWSSSPAGSSLSTQATKMPLTESLIIS